MIGPAPIDPGGVRPSGERRAPTHRSRIEPLGDGALRIVVGETLDPEVNRRVCALAARIASAAASWDDVTDVVPAFAAIGLHYHPERVDVADGERPFDALRRRLLPLLDVPWSVPERDAGSGVEAGRIVEIPVRYGDDAGPDLAAVAAAAGVDPAEVVRRHQHPTEPQRVYLIGFLPGNPYVGRLDRLFDLPRRATPRARLEAGSVCVANRQTVVFPLAAPGGWHVIGRTPLRLFDPARAEPCLLRAGDGVRFRAIDGDPWPAAHEGPTGPDASR